MIIRTVSLCLIRKEDRILVEQTFDEAVKKTFYRPIGGTVEFGENSKQTVIREVREEIYAEINEPELAFVIENIYKYMDQIGHEIDFIYEAELVDKNLYEKEEIDGIEGNSKYKAVWKPIEGFVDNKLEKLVPDGLLDLLLERDRGRTSRVKHNRTT
ncbi:NUDIX hydrolase [Paenibacillus sp. J2TS4]|uniref:NUDIX hydrolase n=1 Tax=Paenibacillus sp. J2TS4 TaxID=2807194 RepID=UPI001B289853|nr:NUDIX domain-containing protein [Paenibacillus sp. J2TS4]GIP32782.1 DNA mismatch repair protein MutT [Paenibacillus sp. J2TS4]